VILQDITIINYKNIREAHVSLSPKMNCLVGHNGVGKTNVLDAIYYLSFCRSAFNAIDSQNITHDADFFMLDGHYLHENGDAEDIFCGMKRGQKKHFKRNKKEYRRLSEHIGLIPIVFVSPDDTMLIAGGSDGRRRFMDMAIAQYDNSYVPLLNNYNKALTSRNTLLRQESEPDGALLDILEMQMAQNGEQIYAKRQSFIEHFIPVFQDIYDKVSAGHEQVGLSYASHCQRGALYDVIHRDRDKDRAVGYSLHGIHRDDLDMTLAGYQMKHEGSQGQNKTYALALKLAQFDFLRQTSSRTLPLLLLDDIFDKLDSSRVEKIVQLVAGNQFGQIFMTDTNREHLDAILQDNIRDYKLFCVDDGKIANSD